MLTIRPALPEDRATLARLSHLAFSPAAPLGETLERYERDPVLQQTSFVAEDGRIWGKYALLDYRVYLRGMPLAMGGIGGVAVAPEGRGQGVATALMNHAVTLMHEQEYPLSMLYGFQHGFYRRLGWACVGEVYRYRVSTRHLPRYRESKDVLPLDRDMDRLAIEALYQSEAPKHNGWLVRNARQWQGHFRADSRYQWFGYWQDGLLEGYLVFTYKKLASDSEELDHLAVREWVVCSSRAYRGLLGFLAAQRDQVEAVVWDTDREDPLPKLIAEQRDARDQTIRTVLNKTGFAAVHSSFMWRMVHLEQALRLRPIHPGANFTLTFEVHDPVLGVHRPTIAVEQGTVALVPTPAKTTVKLDIDRLTQLWCGSWSATAAHWSGVLEVEGDPAVLSALDQAWQTSPPFSWDYF
ncbi:GNAT family N-acetyltransferase [Anthocerotibacter panamensis]|uniref:GNAT family N-acetyltransferase n=1 Tax=Anthocerotibacter panamensis TaxID=2857077 RepID=UPI001C4081DA|nr:GNAT family N-acetyltransferase [Anthocerotibacter panamensis]